MAGRTLAEFWLAVVHTLIDAEDWRFGQAAFNVLAEWRPDLAERVRGTMLDPFYSSRGDTRLKTFLRFLEQNWDA